MLNSIIEKVKRYYGERARRAFGYSLTVDTHSYAIYERPYLGRKVVAAHGQMILVQDSLKKNSLILFRYGMKKRICDHIRLDARTFPGLLDGSSIMFCAFLPYMREIEESRYVKSVRLVIGTDKGQIYHNFPSRGKEFEGNSIAGDILRFEESVVWDLPGRKYPTPNRVTNDMERYYPNLPDECYACHPLENTNDRYHDLYGNGGFGKTTAIPHHGKETEIPRFYLYKREANAIPFHSIGTGEKEYKMSWIATYRSNVDCGVRTCLFASSDGGRSWYCKYEFADMGTYAFRQGVVESWGRNFGNPIRNQGYDRLYSGGVELKQRILRVPTGEDKEPREKFSWAHAGNVLRIEPDEIMTVVTEQPHGLATGSTIALYDTSRQHPNLDWMMNHQMTPQSAGTGVLFKVEALSENTLRLYELVSSPDHHIPARHIHHINRIKDGWIVGTGEIYPNGWLLYIQMKEADTFSRKNASEDFLILRLNSSESSVQRTMGAILRDDPEHTLLFASDHDCLEREEFKITEDRDVTVSRSSTGVFIGKLQDIDDRKQFHAVFEACEPSYYFQQLGSMLVFCGQRGELAISFDDGHSWRKERIREPLIHYFGNSGQYYFFDDCLIYRK